jgi:hypothetical protein
MGTMAKGSLLMRAVLVVADVDVEVAKASVTMMRRFYSCGFRGR